METLFLRELNDKKDVKKKFNRKKSNNLTKKELTT